MTPGLLSDWVQAHAQHLLSVVAGSTTDRRGEQHPLIKWFGKVMNGKLLPQKYAALNLHPANPLTHTHHDVLTSWYVLLSFYDSMHSLPWPNTTSPFPWLMAWSVFPAKCCRQGTWLCILVQRNEGNVWGTAPFWAAAFAMGRNPLKSKY